MRWSWFFCGVFFLLLSAYMDNVRGTLLPVLSQLYLLDYQQAGQFLVLGQLGAFVATAILLPISNRWTLRRIGIVACLVCVLISISSYFVSSKFMALAWGGCLGAGIAFLGSLSSLFSEKSADLEYKTRAMAACHATYGFASFFAPIIASTVLVKKIEWQYLYIALIPALFLLSLFCFKFAPQNMTSDLSQHKQSIKLSRKQWFSVAVVIFYVGGEVLSAMWMTSWFLSVGKTIEEGAWATSLFFMLMTLTRLACAFFAKPQWVKSILWLSILVPSLLFSLGRVFEIYWLIPFMGLVGPFFPLFVAYSSANNPAQSRTIIIWMLTAMQGLLAVVNLATGYFADHFGLGTAYWLPVLLMGICAILLHKNLEVKEN